MPYSTGTEAYRQHNRLFMQRTARAYRGPWKTYGDRVFYSLRRTNHVLYDFIMKVIAKNFADYEFEVLVLGLAIFLDSLPGIPKVSEWTCEVTSLDLSSSEGINVISAVQDEFFEDALEGAFQALTDFIKKVCRTDTFLAQKMIGIGHIIAAVIIHQNEYGHIQQQVKG